MASPYYTTATIVRQTLLKIDSGLNDAEIGVFITMAESIAEALMGTIQFRISFDAEKWGLVRRFCTNLAAVGCLTYDVTEFSTTTQATLTADLLWAQIEFDMVLLKSADIITYLKGL